MTTKRTKYPRTPHLPWSPGSTSDDKVITPENLNFLESCDVVITEKLDGENTTIYTDYCHARSLEGRHHPSRDWIKQFQFQIGYMIPDGWRVCGENMFAKHSIFYDGLTTYFYVFSVWEEDRCLSWGETLAFCEKLGLKTVPVIYKGPWKKIDLPVGSDVGNEIEGYVVRNQEAFLYADFGKNVAKYVRANHVQTDKHWKTTWVKNHIKESSE